MSSSHGSEADDASSEEIPDTLYFDDDGDLRIIVYDEEARKQKAFIASSKAMSFVCNPWKRMLSGDFKEAQADPAGMKEISLPEDDPRALAILLNIAHLRFDNLPKTRMSFEAFKDLIILSSKYCATIILKPWLSTWVEVISGHYYFEYTSGREELLSIYWELGEAAQLEKLARELTWDIGINEGGEIVNMEGKVLNPEDSYYFFPPGLLDSILQLRTQIIGSMLDTLYEIVDRYRTAYDPKCPKRVCREQTTPERRRDCDSWILGSLMISMQSAGLGFERPSTESIGWSAITLYRKLHGIKISSFPSGTDYQTHMYCDFHDDLCKSIGNIREKMASPVLESHHVHMKRQMKLLNIYDDM